MPRKKPAVPKTTTAIRELTLGEVSLWLYRHRRAVQNLLAKDGRVAAWAHFVKQMEADGVTRPSGKALTSESLYDAWRIVAARVAREDEVRAAKGPRPPRCQKANVEPPSRPPPPDTGIRFLTALTYEPPGWRERHPEIYGVVAKPAIAPGIQPQSPDQADPLSRADRMIEAVLNKLGEKDGYVPSPIVRGKIV